MQVARTRGKGGVVHQSKKKRKNEFVEERHTRGKGGAIINHLDAHLRNSLTEMQTSPGV
jgi:hypothetical protein